MKKKILESFVLPLRPNEDPSSSGEETSAQLQMSIPFLTPSQKAPERTLPW